MSRQELGCSDEYNTRPSETCHTDWTMSAWWLIGEGARVGSYLWDRYAQRLRIRSSRRLAWGRGGSAGPPKRRLRTLTIVFISFPAHTSSRATHEAARVRHAWSARCISVRRWHAGVENGTSMIAEDQEGLKELAKIRLNSVFHYYPGLRVCMYVCNVVA